MIYHSENLARVYAGDCRHMADLEDNSVHCVVTSPPYFGLRRYKGLEDLVWDGRPDCQHEWGNTITAINSGGGWAKGDGTYQGESVYKVPGGGNRSFGLGEVSQGNFCQLCGAWKGQLGGEPTIELFIAHTVEVCREVKRVLRPDGNFWLNIGDSMAGSGQGKGSDHGISVLSDDEIGELRKPTDGLKALDACLIPFRLALALQADGWYVREDIIWSKNNPMPESLNGWRWEKHKVKVNNLGRGKEAFRANTPERPQQDHDGKDFKKDAEWIACPGCPKCEPNDGYVLRQGAWRPSNAHEYIFQLTKTDKYYADREAVKEGLSPLTIADSRNESGRHSSDESKWGSGEERQPSWYRGKVFVNESTGRNSRSVWSFPTFGYPGAHFATFPPELPLRCIKASTSEVGVCSKCGKQWSRVIGNSEPIPTGHGAGKKMIDVIEEQRGETSLRNSVFSTGCVTSSNTIGWRPSCKCNAPAAPAIVLDPFAGSGTTLAVAKSLGHIGIGYELSTEYLPMIKERLEDTAEGVLSNQLQLV